MTGTLFRTCKVRVSNLKQQTGHRDTFCRSPPSLPTYVGTVNEIEPPLFATTPLSNPLTRLFKNTNGINKYITIQPGHFEMLCWRKMEKISWIECVRYKEVLHIVKEGRNTLHGINRRKAKWLVTFCVGSAF